MQYFSMESLIHNIKSFGNAVTFDSLGEFVRSLNLQEVDYESFVREPEKEEEYGRNILSLSPFECVLINWPAGSASAVHFHKDFYGYVSVLEGELEDAAYLRESNQLIECKTEKYRKNGLIREPEGIIHQFRNGSKSLRAVSLHFYCPAIESFEGMEIFNLPRRQIGILSDNAITASWSNAPGHFKEVRDQAFEFVSFK
jgi:dTDP-4-dehydrorhamnose 3,5-epimerase-like enzyme